MGNTYAHTKTLWKMHENIPWKRKPNNASIFLKKFTLKMIAAEGPVQN